MLLLLLQAADSPSALRGTRSTQNRMFMWPTESRASQNTPTGLHLLLSLRAVMAKGSSRRSNSSLWVLLLLCLDPPRGVLLPLLAPYRPVRHFSRLVMMMVMMMSTPKLVLLMLGLASKLDRWVWVEGVWWIP